MNPNDRIEIPEGVLMRELQGESVLLDLDSECYYGLDEVGTKAWRALSSGSTIAEACDSLLSEFDVEPERLRADVHELVGQLAEAGLVRVLAV